MKADIILTFKERHYVIVAEYEDIEELNYFWTEGNYGCDCNRSLQIQRHCDPEFIELPCGDTIKLECITPLP